jgi:hypothetical protein
VAGGGGGCAVDGRTEPGEVHGGEEFGADAQMLRDEALELLIPAGWYARPNAFGHLAVPGLGFGVWGLRFGVCDLMFGVWC